MNARAESNVAWLASLSPVLAKLQAERDAEISMYARRHAEAVQYAIETRAAYLADPTKSGAEACRLGSIWTDALAKLFRVRGEIAEAGYPLEQMPREAHDVTAPI